MANTDSVNYSPTFKVPSSGSDLHDVTDGIVQISAFDLHDHTTNKGAAVGRVTATGRVQDRQGADIVSAGSITLGTDGNFFFLTGGVTLSLIDLTGWQAGAEITFFFGQATTVTHNAVPSGNYKAILLAANLTYTFPTISTLTLRFVSSNVWLEIGRTNSTTAMVDVSATQTLTNKAITVPTATPTTAGQLGYGGGHANIGDGAANHVLVDTDSAQDLTNKTVAQPNARIFLTTSQSVPNTTLTIITYDTLGFDSDTMHIGGGQLKCIHAGVYLISAGIEWFANATGDRDLQIYVNATLIASDYRRALTDGSSDTVQGVSTIYALAVNDVVEVKGYQSSGGALNVIGGGGGGNLPTFLAAVRVSS